MSTNSISWYKQGWPWFLIALPSVAVVASFISLAIALQYGDNALQDNYSKRGFAIERDVRRDEAAAQKQLQAELVLAADGSVDLALRSGLERAGATAESPPLLILNFIHPFDAHLDFSVPLQHNNGENYGGRLPAGTRGRWIVELSAPAQPWRLRATVGINPPGFIHGPADTQQPVPQPLSFHLIP